MRHRRFPGFPVAVGLFALLFGVCQTEVGGYSLGADDRSPDEQTAVDFTRDVRPILTDKCFRCHGPDASERKAGLRLDRADDALAQRHGRRAVVPGRVDQSELVRRITSSDEAERMPPAESGKQLTSAEIDTLRRWIADGATWSTHWAYERPRRADAPAARNDWRIHWIDQFVLERIERAKLTPAADADRITLIRRLTFDLTGLPPTPAEVDAFVNDSAPDAYEKVVDRLLRSEAYGERMAMYWLDLVRYADTVGYHGDQEHHISPYRDWVIDAFNDNLRFDQFTREQLAGDLLPNSTIDQKIASGYNRLLQTSHEGGVQAKEYLAIYAADRMRNLSAVWMGATLGCAQCHDHKYDPFTSKDFYSMAAFFADIDEADHLRKGSDKSPTVRKPEISVLSRRERQRLTEIDKRVAQLRRSESATPPGPSSGDSPRSFDEQIAALKKERQEIEKQARLTMITVSIEPRPVRILPRGNWLDDSGALVEPAVPEFLGRLDVDARRATRLDLADWLTDAEDGAGLFTARVFANRFWYLFFGAGLSRSLDDFGGQGQPPSHPELLDRLAHEFVESGWDVKHMVRLIVTSRTYRQSSAAPREHFNVDPENRLWARQSMWRLPAESVRDTSLAISGLIVRELGGPSARPYQPDGYYKHLNFPPRSYEADRGASQWRRGVYVHWQRTYLHPMLKAFDAPSREECTAERPRSRTPLAALALLNDPTFVEAARMFASRVLDEAGPSDGDRIDHAFRLATARRPDESERRALSDLLGSSRERFADQPDSAEALVKIGIAPPTRHNALELASWTMVTRAILNLAETYLRN